MLVALGGADNITVDDLTHTGITQVAIDLSGTPGSGSGDNAADQVTVNGTAGNDQIQVTASGTVVSVSGLAELVTINGAEAGDALTINGGGGNDTINAATVGAGIVNLTIDGGAGNDTITGSDGNDTLIGGDGNDVITGGRGNDTALLGNGNDTFVWNPGDGSDVVEGQAGTDTLVFDGSNAGENMDISANGSRARLFRDVGNVTMDLNGIEHIQLNALGGPDTITVNDLTGTGVTQVAIDLGALPGKTGGDGQPDTVNVSGTAGDDHISVVSSGGSVVVKGLAAQVTIANGDAGDSLVVNGGARQRHHRRVGDQGRPDPISRSTAATATTPSRVALAMTSSTVVAATTWPCSVPATTPSSGIQATAATPSRARPAPTRCSSTVRMPTSRSISRPMAAGCGCSATSVPSRWISTVSRTSTSRPRGAPTPSQSTI